MPSPLSPFPFPCIRLSSQRPVADNSEYHPWHLHGHQFWVLAYGEGTYDPATSNATFNLVDPVYRNTAVVMPYSWTALRMKGEGERGRGRGR